MRTMTNVYLIYLSSQYDLFLAAYHKWGHFQPKISGMTYRFASLTRHALWIALALAKVKVR